MVKLYLDITITSGSLCINIFVVYAFLILEFYVGSSFGLINCATINVRTAEKYTGISI